MKAEQDYISFNSNKSIEELRYNLSHYISTLENVKLELEFYKSLIDKPIFKPHVLNLYEKLADFKNEIHVLIEKRIAFLNKELYAHLNSVKNKIECEDLACDNFFISEHDTIEKDVLSFYKEVQDFKFNLFPYILSVISN